MFYFSRNWILRCLKFSEIVMLLFLTMTTLYMTPRNAWGDEIYSYVDKNGSLAITNIYPLENIDFNTWNSNAREDSTLTDKDDAVIMASIPPQKNINFDNRKRNSYDDLTSEERLHWGRDNALADQRKNRYGQRKKVKDNNCLDAGRYDVTINKIANNLYQDFETRIIIKTRACNELSGKDGSYLDWSGVTGELFFTDTNKSCIVKKVYK
jgi:hypothetical protein